MPGTCNVFSKATKGSITQRCRSDGGQASSTHLTASYNGSRPRASAQHQRNLCLFLLSSRAREIGRRTSPTPRRAAAVPRASVLGGLARAPGSRTLRRRGVLSAARKGGARGVVWERPWGRGAGDPASGDAAGPGEEGRRFIFFLANVSKKKNRKLCC